jgi:hypothetical protein
MIHASLDLQAAYAMPRIDFDAIQRALDEVLAAMPEESLGLDLKLHRLKTHILVLQGTFADQQKRLARKATPSTHPKRLKPPA